MTATDTLITGLRRDKCCRSTIPGPDQELQKGGVPDEGEGSSSPIEVQGATSPLWEGEEVPFGRESRMLCPPEADKFLQFQSENMASPGTTMVHNQHPQVHNVCRGGGSGTPGTSPPDPALNTAYNYRFCQT
ncbi:hypothetical protein PoB_006230900 [Plakobranchus ocellatus]|uniref:Uncharacterized protein n=1 Tax=Plakobranchus ocellatus TaxID=259542 RepID=A0AAV4CV96_9GAST|nr:hypothetical protein PoB_006230900 [Plakobranchus ocellatus]